MRTNSTRLTVSEEFIIDKLADTIRSLRLARSLTQDDVSLATGVSQGIVSRMENNRNIKLPQSIILIRILKYYKVDLDYICNGEPFSLESYDEWNEHKEKCNDLLRSHGL